MDEELLDEIFADLAVDLVDLSDDEIKDRILKYGLSPEDMQEVYDTVKAVQEAEAIGDDNLDPLNLDKIDALADANLDPLNLDKIDALADANTKAAKRMANEDQTSVKITEEDKDADGDTDKTTIEKENPEDDMELTDEERAVIESMGSDKGTEELDNSSETEDNSSETEDKPHEAPKLKNKTNQFARFLGENRLGGM